MHTVSQSRITAAAALGTALIAASLLLPVFFFAGAGEALAAIQCPQGCFADEAACAAGTPGCGAGTSCPQCVSADCRSVASCPTPAAGSAAPSRTKLENPLGTTSITGIVARGTRLFMGLAGSLALLMFVYGGFLWTTSAGNMDKVKKGKQIFTWAVIGLVMIYGSYVLLDLLFRSLQG